MPWPSLDFRFFGHQQAHDASRHGSDDLSGTFFIQRSAFAGAQGSWIVQFNGEARTANPHVKIGGRLLALDFKGLAIDQQ